MLTYMSGADVTDSVDTLRTGAQRKGGLAQVPSALALLQVSHGKSCLLVARCRVHWRDEASISLGALY